MDHILEPLPSCGSIEWNSWYHPGLDCAIVVIRGITQQTEALFASLSLCVTPPLKFFFKNGRKEEHMETMMQLRLLATEIPLID